MTYLVPIAPGIYKHVSNIDIADEIVQSAEEYLLCVYKVQVINCFQILQVVMGVGRLVILSLHRVTQKVDPFDKKSNNSLLFYRLYTFYSQNWFLVILATQFR